MAWTLGEQSPADWWTGRLAPGTESQAGAATGTLVLSRCTEQSHVSSRVVPVTAPHQQQVTKEKREAFCVAPAAGPPVEGHRGVSQDVPEYSGGLWKAPLSGSQAAGAGAAMSGKWPGVAGSRAKGWELWMASGGQKRGWRRRPLQGQGTGSPPFLRPFFEAVTGPVDPPLRTPDRSWWQEPSSRRVLRRVRGTRVPLRGLPEHLCSSQLGTPCPRWEKLELGQSC